MYAAYRSCNLCNKSTGIVGLIRIKRIQLLQLNSRNISELTAAYKPHEIEESEIDENYFTSFLPSSEKPFSLILPPPNITGTLHLGHALTASIQDVLVKWHKMQGRQTMWVPGMDHAGIATQVAVEKKLWKEKGLTRHELGRENFEKEVWKWKQDKSSTIIQQLKRLNIDLNWDKEVFTMDQKRSKAVTEAFIRLFNQGLIYRADHLVNWSCALQSAISDIEVDHLEVDGATDISVPGYERPVRFGVLTRFAYKFADSEDELVVATTRPETILGDVAVAINPKDPRYTPLTGKQLRHPFRNDYIPIIADDFVDPDFGTGAVKVTPAHDPKDFEASKRHNLKPLSVINEKGYMTAICEEFKAIRRFDAREIIISRLAEMQLLRGTDSHKMIVPVCSRSRDVIEFLIRPQWFLKCSTMADKALSDVREGRLKIDPEIFEKNWFQWLENIRDWCISRQLWWGHRIPAYSCHQRGSDTDKVIWVAAPTTENAKLEASKAFSCDVRNVECVQDEDVLDTWFSSGLQPFTVFEWPDKTDDLKKYYPLTLMETGHDILFFWVARMVMLGTQLTGQLPFTNILLHGIICDAHGRKMSKSLGNVIAPEDVIDGATLEQLGRMLNESFKTGILSAEELKKASEGQKKMFPNGIPECGADALRFTLLSHNVKNHVINFDISECHTNRLFGNKIWQATKFALLWTGKVSESWDTTAFEKVDTNFDNFAPMDRWILSKLSHMLHSVNVALENHEFYEATGSLKNFLYYEFCDVYLESVKTDFKERAGEYVSKGHCITLLICLDHSLRALAPFMPVLSQHLHKHLPRLWKVGLDRSFPKAICVRNESLEEEVDEIVELVTGIRRLKKIFNVTFKYRPEVYLIPSNVDVAHKFSQVIKDLSHLDTLHIMDTNSSKPGNIGIVEDIIGQNKIYLVVPHELRKNLELDSTKMENKKEKLLKELEKMNRMVSGSGYKENATLESREIHAKKIRSEEANRMIGETLATLTSQQLTQEKSRSVVLAENNSSMIWHSIG